MKLRINIHDILKCPKCGKPFKKIDSHTYEPDCGCYDIDIRVSVGNSDYIDLEIKV